MNIKQNIFAVLAAAVLLASCSQDEMMTDAGHDGLVRVTLSAAATDGVQTRATSTTDDPLGRCLIQILEKDKDETAWTKGTVQGMTPGSDGTYTLTNVMLNPDKEYTFLFWADGGESYYTATDLTAVTFAESAKGAGIAYQTKVSWDGSEEVEAELTHAVGKVSLKSTTAVTASTTVAVTVPKAYSGFNVLEGTMVGEAASYAHSGTGTGQTGNQFSFYALVDDETQSLTLNAGGSDVSIANVPLGPDKHIILEGDVAGAGWTAVSFSASMADDWGSTIELEIVGSTYLVSSYEALMVWAEAARNDPSLNCKLKANIILPEVEEGGSNWTTIPNFTGTFDGNLKMITGLTGAGGLFGTIGSGGEVLNLALEDVKITTAGNNVGAIAGTNHGTVSDCWVDGGSVQGSLRVGGIVGSNEGSVVDCSCTATVNSDGSAGGIAGFMASGNVVGCTSAGDVTGTSGNVGGVVGNVSAGSIVCCGSTSNVVIVDVGSGVGGVAGCLATSTCEVMYCCYSGNQISGGAAGGVIGVNQGGGKVTACYWSGCDYGIGFKFPDDLEVDVTKVDGDWTEAVAALNAAMAGTAYESYEWEAYEGKPEIYKKFILTPID